jgi:hypothetical protein
LSFQFSSGTKTNSRVIKASIKNYIADQFNYLGFELVKEVEDDHASDEEKAQNEDGLGGNLEAAGALTHEQRFADFSGAGLAGAFHSALLSFVSLVH